MRIRTAAITFLVGLATLAGPTEVADAAAAPIQFTKIQFDSPGSDTGSNASLNAEYVVIKNKSTRSYNLKGWTVRDAQNHVYRFATNFTLKPGKSVVLHTGRGSNTASNRYWGSRTYIWNNTGDKAALKNASGRSVDSCAWTRRGSGTIGC